MLKFLLIIFLFFFILFRVGGLIFRMLGGGSPKKGQNPKNRGRKYSPQGGNVDVDFEPGKPKKKKGYDGGEYVDFEEL